MPAVMPRLEAWAERRAARIAGHNPWLVSLRVVQRAGAVRITGLAAEMAYYALVSLIPLLVATGAGLGLLERVIGAARVRQFEDALVRGLEGVFSPEVSRDVLEPLVRGLLADERTGIAIVGLGVTLWFASGAFRAVIRALDDAYRVPERRSMLAQWGIAYGLTLGAIVVTLLMLALMVVGPLLGAGRLIADELGLGRAMGAFWDVGRWPVALAVASSFLALVYHVGPNVQTRWRDCLPGAVLGTVGTLLIAVGLRLYLGVAGPRAPEIGDAAEAVQIASQTIGVVLSGMLWIWLTSAAVLVGGVLNAELARSRGERPPLKA